MTSQLPNEILLFLENYRTLKESSITKLAGDASSRKYYRLHWFNQTSSILMWDQPFSENESSFINILKHFQKNNIYVPKILSISPQQGLILLEDFGDLTLEQKFWETQVSKDYLPFYKKAIDQLTYIHYSATADNSPCSAFNMSFDHDKLTWELNHTLKHLILGLCEVSLSQKDHEKLQNIFSDISQQLANEPTVICHRDYHSRNLMVHEDKVKVIDFQDARLGPIQYDLVSLLKDSYVHLNSQNSRELIFYYFEQRKKFTQLPPPSSDQFQNIFELQSIQRCLKACGSFASFYQIKQDDRYLKYIPKTIQYVTNSLDFFPQYSFLKQILNDQNFPDRCKQLQGSNI